jgi:hypothetical protein
MERKIYFKTQEGFEAFINLLPSEFINVRKAVVSSSCGETNGAYVYENETTKQICTLIIDESEYNNAMPMEKGE